MATTAVEGILLNLFMSLSTKEFFREKKAFSPWEENSFFKKYTFWKGSVYGDVFYFKMAE